MKRIIAVTAAALMGTSLLAGPVAAQTGTDSSNGSATQQNVTGGSAGQTDSGSAEGPAGASSDTGTSSGTMGTTGAMEGDVDAGTTAAIDSEPSFDSALSAIENNSQSTAALGTMSEVGSVEVVKISDLEGADMTALESARSEGEEDITALQEAIDGNEAISQALADESVETSSVVAAETAADGQLVVYVE